MNLSTLKNALLSAGIAALITAPAAAAAPEPEVAFEPDFRLPLVHVNIALKAGAVTDPAGQSGITNFMGKMLLRGTRSRTKEQINMALDQMGAHIGIETRAEALVIRGSVLAAQLDPFLRLVTEIVTRPAFPEQEIKRLKSELISGLLQAQGNDGALAGKHSTRFLFGSHPYSTNVVGRVKDLEKLTPAQVSKHYDRLVRAANLLIVGAGAADEGKIRAWGHQLARQRPGGTAEAVVGKPTPSAKRRLLIVDKPDRTQATIIINQLGTVMTAPEYFALYAANNAFGGGGFNTRLMQEIRVQRGWSYGAHSHFRMGLQPRSWQITFSPAVKDTPAALAYALEMAEKLKETGLTATEFDFSKTSLINNAGFAYNTPEKRVENILLERTLNLPSGFMRSYADELSKLTLEQTNAALRAFLKPESLSVTVVGTAKDLKEPLAKAVGIPVDQVVVIPYTQD